MDVILRSDRLVLRPLRLADAPAIVTGLNDFEVTRYLTRVPYPYTEADAQHWLATLKPPVPGVAHFAIELPGEGMIGVVSIENELGYWLGEPHWGKGIMSEAVKALLEAAFATRLYPRLKARALKTNAGSLNVLEKAGFKRTGEGPDPIAHRSGELVVSLELEQPKWT